MSDASRPGLRTLAERRGFRIGTCVSAMPLHGDTRYAEALAREFNVLTPENAMKFGPLSPEPGIYDFTEADAIVDFALAHEMDVRGHVLVWYAQLPRWLERSRPTRAELVDVLTRHIATVVGRYAGRIRTWDVVNEAIAADGSFRETLWQKTIGAEYLDIAFHAARAADPSALLFYNDYGIEATGAHADAVSALLRDLRARNIPVDGVGLQMHVRLDQPVDCRTLQTNMQRLADLGLRVQVTECDVRIPIAQRPTEAQLSRQAEVYRSVLQASLRIPGCDCLGLWGFTDRHSWVTHFFPGEGAALLLDEDYRAKPAYHALATVLSEG